MTKTETTLITVTITLLLTLAVLFMLFGHLWEDGSWAIGNFPYILKGCLPWGICS